jgi:acetyl-CoA synthetase
MAFPACLSSTDYRVLYDKSLENPDEFWSSLAQENLSWIKASCRGFEGEFCRGSGRAGWFSDGILNASFNCLDRHLSLKADHNAILWIGENFDHRYVTYRELLVHVCKFANFLAKDLRVTRGECVTIYMSMVPEAIVAMLACARIGAVHNVVFGGFSALALKERIINCRSRVVICSRLSLRNGKHINLLQSTVDAVKDLSFVDFVVVHGQDAASLPTIDSRIEIFDFESSTRDQESTFCPSEQNSEDPLFILYTSGSTGKPKAVVHSTAGYLLYAMATLRYVFDVREGDIMGTFADIGWITGHSYIVYGPLLNGVTTVLFEGNPLFPDCNTIAKAVQRFGITQLYTAPTVIRLLKQNRFDSSSFNLSSLRLIGSVGEPLNSDASKWYKEHFGTDAVLVDTYWQSETGGHMITCLPCVTEYKPGAASFPFFGVKPVLLDEHGEEIKEPDVDGSLFFATPWPGMARTLWNDHARFIQCYFPEKNGLFYTGDRAFRDAQGYYYIRGRMDDVINTSGHRLSSAELEFAACSCPLLSECAAVGKSDDLIGEAIWLFCILKHSTEQQEYASLVTAVKESVRRIIGPLATPKMVFFVKELPKTRSGKIMRRLLKKLVNESAAELGDVSTLNNPESLADIRHVLCKHVGS